MAGKNGFGFLKGRSVSTLMALSILSLVTGLTFVSQSYVNYTYKTRASEIAKIVQCPMGSMPLFQNAGIFNTQNISIPGTIIESTKGAWEIGEEHSSLLAKNGEIIRLIFPYAVIFEKVITHDTTIDGATSGPEMINGEFVRKPTLKEVQNTLSPQLSDMENKGPYTYLDYLGNGGDTSFNICVSVQQ